jgi:hypothetical protein
LDEELKTLVEAAERCDPVLPLRILTPAAFIQGQLVSDEAAWKLHAGSLLRALRVQQRGHANETEAEEARKGAVREMLRGLFDNRGGAFNIEPETILLSSGASEIDTEIIRVPFSQVTMWWVGRYEARSDKGGGAWVGFGAVIPLGQ